MIRVFVPKDAAALALGAEPRGGGAPCGGGPARPGR